MKESFGRGWCLSLTTFYIRAAATVTKHISITPHPHYLACGWCCHQPLFMSAAPTVTKLI